MTKRINTYVTVGETTYEPGEIPDEVAAQIENTSVFEDDAPKKSTAKSGK